ncbi:MAG: chromosomal replication initiator protein DnaA [Candidatus Brocadiae bacterium]|nr:chromosomal replication initiator protein DnaA [Candidatus Brocadiia bacterium]
MLPSDAVALRDRVFAELSSRLPEDEFKAWFDPGKIHLTASGASACELHVRNVFMAEHYERNYRKTLEDVLASVAQGPVRLAIRVNGEAGRHPAEHVEARAEQLAETRNPDPPGPFAQPVSSTPRPGLVLNPNYTFENFVVGISNRLAHAAAMSVAQSPGAAYNPLFLHGSVGLGKTHLLQAICHEILKQNPRLNIVYQSCEEFVNDYIASVQQMQQLEAFRAKMRAVDILLIDDIHFLAGKEGSQEEFFHTFNTLHNASKQIILCSDSPPKDIPTLEDRLVTRFSWGLVARVDTPTFETRVAILKRKAEARGTPFPEDVYFFIAQNIESNIRELEGAVTKVAAYASLLARPIDLDVAREALRDALEVASAPVSIPDVQAVVCRKLGVKTAELQSKSRTKSISRARQIGIYLARTMTNASQTDIGNAFGGRDHSTVSYAIDTVKDQIGHDPSYRSFLEALADEIRKSKL